MSLSAKDHAELHDAMELLVEMVNGYRAKMEEAGYSSTAAEIMAVDYHRMVLMSMIHAAQVEQRISREDKSNWRERPRDERDPL